MDGFSRLALADVDSTNLEVMRRAKAGEKGPLWITATSQNQGRGRLGREWISEAGNLYATLLIQPETAPEHIPGLAFVAGLSLADSFAELSPKLDFRLKWPNDILANGEKIAGILIESEMQEGQFICAIGCGLNLKHFPQTTRYPATSLAAHGFDISPDQAFAALNRTFAKRLAEWDQGRGFALTRQAWQSRAFAMGETISLDLGAEIITGRFIGLALDGAMLLQLADGATRAIHAGEVCATQMPGMKS